MRANGTAGGKDRRSRAAALRGVALGAALAALLLAPLASRAASDAEPARDSTADVLPPEPLERERGVRERVEEAWQAADPFVAPVFDLIVLRPLGAAATAVGVPFFVAATPFVAPRYGLQPTFDVFLYPQFDYTFLRPLGEF